jgi:hypothetical protein
MASNAIGQLYINMPDVQKRIFDTLSLTSQFKVSLLLGDPTALTAHLDRCGLLGSKNTEKYDFLCAEATLPGSTFDMGEEYGSRQGIIERFPNRRVYSDFNLTFYVDAEYNVIRLFEEWMNFIDPLYSKDSVYTGSPNGQAQERFKQSEDYFRFKYPDTYKKNIAITKFERDFIANPNQGARTKDQSTMTYYFIDAFPTNLTALPLSYEGSTITKTTINFSYTRYTVDKHNGTKILRTKTPTTNNVPGNNFGVDFSIPTPTQFVNPNLTRSARGGEVVDM